MLHLPITISGAPSSHLTVASYLSVATSTQNFLKKTVSMNVSISLALLFE